jgi:hypothetical protein
MSLCLFQYWGSDTYRRGVGVQISEMEAKLSVLRQGTVLVAPEERKQVEEAYNLKLGMWRKRKNMFRDLWATITEAMTEDSKQLKVCFCLGTNMQSASLV